MKQSVLSLFPGKVSVGLLVTLLLVSMLAGCASQSGSVYSTKQTRVSHRVEYGTVTDVRQVKIEGEQSGLGVLGGAVIGGVIGSTMGASTGRTLAILGGSVAGAAAGAAGEQAMKNKDGVELTVRLDNGSVVSIVQEADEFFATGERVRVLTANDGSARVRH
ncbi:hypothetical protein [Oleidesulfovibrio sp.]|uniref:outer membrane lipoprotein n=1 Tax=Oleidesulfovibrio sp. TaxID=2909707 RepID=UPI003A83DAF3